MHVILIEKKKKKHVIHRHGGPYRVKLCAGGLEYSQRPQNGPS